MTSSLNRIFKVIWSKVQMAWVAVSEATTAHGKQQSITRITRTVTTVVMLTGGAAIAAPPSPPAPNQLPTGGQVAAGIAAIGTNGNTMTITQSSNRAAINWNTFDIGSQAAVNFVQPSANAVALNRVNSPNPSQIYGQLSSNGQVYLINAAGVYFAPGAQVNVGGIVATTHSMSDAAFMAGSTKFDRNGSTGSVINEGSIQTTLNGYIAMLAPEVRNSGLLVAQAGTIAMAAGESITLNFGPTSKLESLTVTEAQLDTLVENRHAIRAPNGLVILSARATNQLAASVINSGTIEAKSVSQQGGRIVLEGTAVTNIGTLDTSSDTAQGGTIEINGKRIALGGSIKVDGQTFGGTVKALATEQLTATQANIRANANQQGGQGGNIQLAANQLTVTDSTINADGNTQGGSININGVGPTNAADVLGPNHPLNNPLAPPTGPSTVALAGSTTISSRSRYGIAGQTTVTGDHISLNDSTKIDATGATQGGTVLIGGDWQGSNGTYQATMVTMQQGVVIDASATDIGNGGKVVLWSDVTNQSSWTNAYGSVYARGGINGGDGGRIETSGHALDIAGVKINAGSAYGNGGLWLLDPYNYDINNSGPAGTINTALNNSTSVVIDTTYSSSAGIGSTGTGLGNIIFSGSINKSNASATATLTFNAANWIDGLGTISSTGNVLNVVFNVGANGVANGFGGQLGGLISGNVSITKNGIGELSLSADNTYTGNTTINAGGLVLSGYRVQLGSAAGYNVYNGGTLSFNRTDVFGTYSDNVQNFINIYDGGIVTNKGTYFNRLGGLNFYGNGTLTSIGGASVSSMPMAWALAGNVYSGANTQALISGSGYALLGSPSAFGTSFNVNTGGSLSVTATLIDSSTASWYTAQSSYLTKVGEGALTLSGTNTYTGATSIGGGVLNLGSSSAVGSSGPINFQGGTLQYSANNTTDYSSRFSTAGGQAFNIDTNGQSVTFSSAFSSSGGTLTKLGTGFLSLAGANTYTGGTNINAGVLNLGSSGAVGSTGSISFGGGALQYSASNNTDYSARFSTASSQAYKIDTNGYSVTFGSALVSGSGSLTKLGVGTLTLTGSNTYSGTTTVGAGSLMIGNGTANGSINGASNITVSSGATVGFNRTDALTIGNNISGSGGVTISQNNNLNITGVATYTGNTSIGGGVLTFTNNAGPASANYTGTGSLVIQPSASFSSDYTFNANVAAVNRPGNHGG